MAESSDIHFRQFAVTLEKAIGKYGDFDDLTKSEFDKIQQRQLKELIGLEDEFRRTLINKPIGIKVYRTFVRYIVSQKRNILAARPFFRERQRIFTRSISKALKTGDIEKLQKFRFNFTFIQFILASHDWRPNAKVVRIARKIVRLRWELVTLNLPLAISRARIFFSRTPRSHLDYMDFVDIACEGLMNAVDKYVPSVDAGAFPSVAIQRMTGNFIEEYSETKIHFYPVDKRKIYRANKILGRQSDQNDLEALANKVNIGVEKSGCTTANELAGLLAAQSCISIELQVQEGEDSVRIEDRFEAPRETQPDVICENRDLIFNLNMAMSVLTIFEQKLLRLRGLSL